MAATLRIFTVPSKQFLVVAKHYGCFFLYGQEKIGTRGKIFVFAKNFCSALPGTIAALSSYTVLSA
jgi:hypothetical protein